jgi:hypothetical protein
MNKRRVVLDANGKLKSGGLAYSLLALIRKYRKQISRRSGALVATFVTSRASTPGPPGGALAPDR